MYKKSNDRNLTKFSGIFSLLKFSSALKENQQTRNISRTYYFHSTLSEFLSHPGQSQQANRVTGIDLNLFQSEGVLGFIKP